MKPEVTGSSPRSMNSKALPFIKTPVLGCHRGCLWSERQWQPCGYQSENLIFPLVKSFSSPKARLWHHHHAKASQVKYVTVHFLRPSFLYFCWYKRSHMALVLQFQKLPVLSGLGPWKKADYTHTIYFLPSWSVNCWVLSHSFSNWMALRCWRLYFYADCVVADGPCL